MRFESERDKIIFYAKHGGLHTIHRILFKLKSSDDFTFEEKLKYGVLAVLNLFGCKIDTCKLDRVCDIIFGEEENLSERSGKN